MRWPKRIAVHTGGRGGSLRGLRLDGEYPHPTRECIDAIKRQRDEALAKLAGAEVVALSAVEQQESALARAEVAEAKLTEVERWHAEDNANHQLQEQALATRIAQLERDLERTVSELERLTGVIGEEDCDIVHATLADLAKPEGT